MEDTVLLLLYSRIYAGLSGIGFKQYTKRLEKKSQCLFQEQKSGNPVVKFCIILIFFMGKIFHTIVR